MEPDIKKNDRLIVEKTSQLIDSGQIYICSINGEVVVKKVFESDEAYILVSTNDDYVPKTVYKKDIVNEDVEFYIEGILRGKLSYEF